MIRGGVQAAVAAAALALAVLALWPEPQLDSAPRDAARPAAPGERAADAAPGGVAVTALAPPARRAAAGEAERRPASLRGTEVDGGLVTDASGRFVPTPDARRLFEHYFAASGEEPEAAIVARIRAEIDRRLPPEAARDAHLLLDRWLVYRARARELAEQGLGEKSLEERHVAVRELRRETLGEEAALALFAEEEDVDAAALAKLRLDEDPSLGPDERTAHAAALEASLPEAERASRRAAIAALELRRAEEALRAQGGSADELRALRERSVGPAAAERLAALDATRAAWRARVDEYRAARAALEADASLSASERDAAIERLRGERFTATERLRVEALDEIELR